MAPHILVWDYLLNGKGLPATCQGGTEGWTCIALPILTLALEWGRWLGPCPSCFTSIVKEAGVALGAALNRVSLAHSMV
jgi:hypothetical protein